MPDLLRPPVRSPLPRLLDDGLQRLRQLGGCELVKVEHDGSAFVVHLGEVTVLIGKQGDSHKWHGVVYGLIKTTGAPVRHKRPGLRVTLTGATKGFYPKRIRFLLLL